MSLSKIIADSLHTTAVIGALSDNTVTSAKLTTTGVVANNYGDANNIPVVTVDAQGRVSSVTLANTLTTHATTYSNATSYADTKASAAYANVFNGGTFTGNVVFTSNVTANTVRLNGTMQVDGDLIVTGNTVTMNVTSLSVEDNMIYLNASSNVANPDLGIAGNYNDGTYRHAGMFRDATDGVWKFFHQYQPEPDASAYIDTSNNTFALANVQANTFIGNITGNTANITTSATVGANDLTVGTSLYVVANGNVGINTSSPAQRLTVQGDNNNIRIRSSSNTRFRSDYYITSAGTAKFNSYDDTGSVYKPVEYTASSYSFYSNTSGLIRAVDITTDGRMGVGTSTPGTVLEIMSQSNSSNIEVRARANNSHYVDMGTTRDGSYHYFFGYGSNTGVAFAANSSIKSYITPDGNMGLGTTTPGSTMAWGLPTFEISGSRPALSLRSSGTLATIRISSSSGNNNADWHINTNVSNTSTLNFNAQGGSVAPPLAMTYDGKVGIGNSSPQTTLDVRGPILVGDYASSGLYNSNAILHVRKQDKPHIVLEDIGHNTCGIAINGTSGMVFGNESGGFEWRTGTSYNGDVTSTGTSRMSLNTSGSLYLGYGLSAPGGYFPYDVGNWTYDANRGYYGDGLTHGGGYPSGSNRPYTYDYCLSVIGGSRGFQLAANWIGGNNISIRTLRDCCSNWFSWVELQQVSSSDRRRKTNIEPIANVRSIIESLEGVAYDAVNEDGTLGDYSVEDPDLRVERPKEFGYIAQDAQPIIPGAVKHNPLLDTPNELGWASAYHIEYQRLVPVLTEAMKEMYAEIDRLKAEIEVLKNA